MTNNNTAHTVSTPADTRETAKVVSRTAGSPSDSGRIQNTYTTRR